MNSKFFCVGMVCLLFCVGLSCTKRPIVWENMGCIQRVEYHAGGFGCPAKFSIHTAKDMFLIGADYCVAPRIGESVEQSRDGEYLRINGNRTYMRFWEYYIRWD